jgi:hypothetical protein
LGVETTLRIQPRCHTRHDRRTSTQLQPAIRFAQEITAVFDGGRLSSDSGVMLLALLSVGATSPLRSPL